MLNCRREYFEAYQVSIELHDREEWREADWKRDRRSQEKFRRELKQTENEADREYGTRCKEKMDQNVNARESEIAKSPKTG